jgi:hypothetical protein
MTKANVRDTNSTTIGISAAMAGFALSQPIEKIKQLSLSATKSKVPEVFLRRPRSRGLNHLATSAIQAARRRAAWAKRLLQR